MTPTTDEAENLSVPKPLTSNGEIIQIIFERLAELQQQADALDLHATALDQHEAIISRLSQRITNLEEAIGIPCTITLPSLTISHNPRPGSLSPKKRGEIRRETYTKLEDRRHKQIAAINNTPQVLKKAGRPTSTSTNQGKK